MATPREGDSMQRAVLLEALTWIAVMVLGAGSASANPPAGPESPLLAYFQLATAENPGLTAAHAEWMASGEEARRVESLPDLRLSYGYFIQSVETALGPQEHRIAVTQTLPWFGKRGFRGEAATHATSAAEQGLRAVHLGVLQGVARAYYELAYLEQMILVTGRSLELVQFQERVARTRYRTGAASHPDVIRAQVELGILEDRLRTLEDRRISKIAALNEALGRNASDSLPFPVALSDTPLTVPADSVAIARVLSQNPELLALNHATDARQSQIDAAHRDRYPDLTLGVETILIGESELTSFADSGRDAWLATASISLPLWRGKYGAAIQQAKAQHRATEARREDVRHRLRAHTEEALYRLRDARRKIELYRDSLIPKGEESLRATSTAFQTGDASFLDVIDALRTLLQFDLELARARADRGQTAVDVMALMNALPSGATEATP
jgi:outer membrane protein TolC